MLHSSLDLGDGNYYPRTPSPEIYPLNNNNQNEVGHGDGADDVNPFRIWKEWEEERQQKEEECALFIRKADGDGKQKSRKRTRDEFEKTMQEVRRLRDHIHSIFPEGLPRCIAIAQIQEFTDEKADVAGFLQVFDFLSSHVTSCTYDPPPHSTFEADGSFFFDILRDKENTEDQKSAFLSFVKARIEVPLCHWFIRFPSAKVKDTLLRDTDLPNVRDLTWSLALHEDKSE